MVVETRYAAGDGVLLGSGDHWVLVTDPRDEDVLEDLWAVVSQRPSRSPARWPRQVLALLARSFDGDPPALAVVDLSSGGSASVSRGRGHVRVVGADRVLSLDGGAEASGPAPTRRLVGGVVAASRAEVRPLSHRVAPAPAVHGARTAPGVRADRRHPRRHPRRDGPRGPATAAAPPTSRARPRRPRTPGRCTTPPSPTPGSWSASTRAAAPPSSRRRRTPTGARARGRRPRRRDRAPPRAGAAPAPRHGGDGAGGQLPAGAPDLARRCPRAGCATSGSPRRSRAGCPVPPSAGSRLPTGEVVPLDRGVVLGRKPAPLEGTGDWPHLVHLPSGPHVRVAHAPARRAGRLAGARPRPRLPGWHHARPCPDANPERMRAGEAYVLEPGSSLDLAEVYEVRFEVGPVGRHGERAVSAPVIPGFQFVEHLGSGGFADVFLYEQQWPRQRVAVKVVRPDVPLNEREKQLFTAEANAMARLADHPYIVSVITAGVTAGRRPSLPGDALLPAAGPRRAGAVQPDAGGRRGGHRHQARQRDRDGAPLGHPAPRHQAQQRAGHDLPRARAHRLRHRRPHGRHRGRERRADLLPVVPAGAARRPVQRLGGLRRLLARRHHLAPARGALARSPSRRGTTRRGR